VVDEAHYFLHDVDVSGLLDLELNGYTLVSYRASRLEKNVLNSSQAIVVTRESDPNEVRSLFALCGSCQGRKSEAEWHELLDRLAIGKAIVLPLTEEAQGEIRRIHLTPRLTPHVRHLAKYIDIPVPESRAFVFWRDGVMTRDRARTLQEFVDVLERSPVSGLDGHLRRGDFSRWIGDVFGDYPLSKTVRQIEQDYLSGTIGELPVALAQAVRSRYEFLEPVPNPRSSNHTASHNT
jgi:hypothetical protein